MNARTALPRWNGGRSSSREPGTHTSGEKKKSPSLCFGADFCAKAEVGHTTARDRAGSFQSYDLISHVPNAG